MAVIFFTLMLLTIETIKVQTVQIRDPANTLRQRVDKAFGKTSTQKQLYNYLSESIQKAGDGYNVTIFSYGQTGSGKTYTMFGSDWDNILAEPSRNGAGGVGTKKQQQTFYGNIESDDNFAGVIPRCIHHVFSKLTANRKHVKVFCSFLQLYNQKMVDLLNAKGTAPLIIHQNKTDGIYVEGLTELEVANFDDCLRVMRDGERNRIVRQTNMNMKSSRSHTIFQFLIEEVFPEKQSYRRTKINLCDLAGSEKINKAEEMQIEHFNQLKNINLSLTTLGKVIWALSSSGKTVPAYRDCKLTRLLQDSLGGNTYTVIIGNITSKQSSIDETTNTLKFLQRARQVKTEVFVKTYTDQPEMQKMHKQILYLKNILKLKRIGGSIETSDELAERVKVLEQENRRLKQIADTDAVQRLVDENNRMKRELRKIGETSVYNSNPNPHNNFFSNSQEFSTIDKDQYRTQSLRDEEDGVLQHRKQDTSQTIDKNSTNSQLPHLGSRYSSHSKPSDQGLSRSRQPMRNKGITNQNIILRRLQQIQKLKFENKQKLEKQLLELEKSDKSITSDKPFNRPKHI